jgi:hypothetical protein
LQAQETHPVYSGQSAQAGGVQSTPTGLSVTTTQTAPAAPNTAVARNSNGTTTVSWPAIQFANNFTVLRSTDGTNFTALAAGTNLSGSTTSFTDATASGNNFYYYEVTASNAAGNTTSGSVYVANGDGFAVTYFPGPLVGPVSTPGSFQLNTTNPPASDTLSYWQDVANPLTPNPSAPASGFSGTNTYQTVDSTINFSGNDATKPPSTPAGFNSADSGGPGHSISGEWDFTVIPQYSGQYTFFPSTDDGTQLYVDGKLLDDQGFPGNRGNTPDATPVTDGSTPPTNTNANGEPVGIYGGTAIPWTAGSTHTVRMIWANGGGGWDAHLYWASGGNTAANPTANFGQPYAVLPGYEAYATISPANVTANLTGASTKSSSPGAAARPIRCPRSPIPSLT